MSPSQIIALIGEGLALAGALLSRHGIDDRGVVEKALAAVETLTDAGRRLAEGREVLVENIEALVSEFRVLKAASGVTPDALRAMAARIEDQTAALKASLKRE